MESADKSKKTIQAKVSINLPEQKTWNQLEGNAIKSALEKNIKKDCKTLKKIERLMDKAFDLLLEKVIRQS